MLMNSMVIILGLAFFYMVCFSFLTATVFAEKMRNKYVLGKAVQRAAFLLVFCVATQIGKEEGESFLIMLWPFLCCFVGDILMGCYNRTRKKPYFVGGVVTFLSGHIGFVYWLCSMQRLQWVDFILPACAIFLSIGIIHKNKLHTGSLKPFILTYSMFVSMLFSKSMHIALVDRNVAAVVTAVAATLFWTSDVSILFLYFKKQKTKKVQMFNLATYYIGMFLFAIYPLLG